MNSNLPEEGKRKKRKDESYRVASKEKNRTMGTKSSSWKRGSYLKAPQALKEKLREDPEKKNDRSTRRSSKEAKALGSKKKMADAPNKGLRPGTKETRRKKKKHGETSEWATKKHE